MKRFNYYLQLVLVCVIGGLLLSSCNGSEDTGLKPSSKPSYKYSDYKYETFGATNVARGIFLQRMQKSETCDVWTLRVQCTVVPEVGELHSLAFYLVLPHQESTTDKPVLLPGYYPVKTQDVASGDLTPFTIYNGKVETDFQSKVFYVSHVGTGVSQAQGYNTSLGDVYIRSFSQDGCDFDVHCLLVNHDPLAYTVNSAKSDCPVQIDPK